MCGIAGILDRTGSKEPRHEELAVMAAAIRHRGPDEFGVYRDGELGFSHARLSIIDLSGGSQPMCNEDGSVWLTYNGEIYNYLELRPELESLGHRFRTRSDTEVLIHAYEQWPESFAEKLNGNFAFGIWDRTKRRLVLGRDRLGIRPLFWAFHEGRILFASEMKCLVAAGYPARVDALGLDQAFVAWTSVAPRTVLEGVRELPPGHLLQIDAGREPREEAYWDLPAPPAPGEMICDEREAARDLRSLLEDSVKLRLRADVTVGAYLSGGLDSTIATALVRSVTDTPLETYSIAFGDKDFDESAEQDAAVRALGTEHHKIVVSYDDIARAFAEVVALAEKPLMRTAPVPLFLLSGLVRSQGRKVVLTGEGADEIFGGYDIFKEAKIRAWWGRRPESRMRPALLRKLYPFAPGADRRAAAFFEAFYREGIENQDDPGFSHRPTWKNGLRNRGFFSEEIKARLRDHDTPSWILERLASGLSGRSVLARAEYLETKVFLAGHLLASQGDRMSLGHSVEGRYPFLDHRIVELGQRLAPWLKLRGLSEKWILREAHRDLIPEDVLTRPKRPYIAPNVRSFREGFGRELAEDLLAEGSIEGAGLFDPPRVRRLAQKVFSDQRLGERETMAFVGILSAQLLARRWAMGPSVRESDIDLAEFPLRGGDEILVRE